MRILLDVSESRASPELPQQVAHMVRYNNALWQDVVDRVKAIAGLDRTASYIVVPAEHSPECTVFAYDAFANKLKAAIVYPEFRTVTSNKKGIHFVHALTALKAFAPPVFRDYILQQNAVSA
jgi:hypothetical protein